MFIEGDLAAHGRAPARYLAGSRARGRRHRRRTDPRSPRQITSGVVYRFLHRPVSAPRVRLFVEAALRRHEVENVERTLEQTRPDFSRFEAAKPKEAPKHAAHAGHRGGRGIAAWLAVGGWFVLSSRSRAERDRAANRTARR